MKEICVDDLVSGKVQELIARKFIILQNKIIINRWYDGRSTT